MAEDIEKQKVDHCSLAGGHVRHPSLHSSPRLIELGGFRQPLPTVGKNSENVGFRFRALSRWGNSGARRTARFRVRFSTCVFPVATAMTAANGGSAVPIMFFDTKPAQRDAIAAPLQLYAGAAAGRTRRLVVPPQRSRGRHLRIVGIDPLLDSEDLGTGDDRDRGASW